MSRLSRHSGSIGAVRQLLLTAAVVAAATAHSSDGATVTPGQFPAVAGYYEFFVYRPPDGEPEVAYAEQSCSGALISEKVILTAAHCAAFNYTEDIGTSGYCDRATRATHNRVDQQSAHEFIQCVLEDQDDVQTARRKCSAENAIGLCD